jgi:hypothetical protein
LLLLWFDGLSTSMLTSSKGLIWATAILIDDYNELSTKLQERQSIQVESDTRWDSWAKKLQDRIGWALSESEVTISFRKTWIWQVMATTETQRDIDWWTIVDGDALECYRCKTIGDSGETERSSLEDSMQSLTLLEGFESDNRDKKKMGWIFLRET